MSYQEPNIILQRMAVENNMDAHKVYNGLRAWFAFYDDDNEQYIIVPHSFVFGKEDSGLVFGQFITNLWFSKKLERDQSIKCVIVIAKKHVLPCKIENCLNNIGFMNNDLIHSINQYTYTMNDNMCDAISENSGTMRSYAILKHSAPEERSSPSMSFHVRHIEKNGEEYYVISHPYFHLTL